MPSSDQRVVVCNERYTTLYGLTPADVKPGTTRRAIVGYRALGFLATAPVAIPGIVLAVGSGIAGFIMAWQRDEARFSVLPLRVSSLKPGELSLGQALPQGAMVRLAF